MSKTETLLQELQEAQNKHDRNKEYSIQEELGKEFFLSGDFLRAINFYESSLALSRETQDLRSQATTSNNIGNVYLAINNPQRAIYFYEQALGIARQIGDQKLKGNILSSMGLAYDKTGNITRAIEFYENALKIAREEQALEISQSLRLDSHTKDLSQKSFDRTTLSDEEIKKIHKNDRLYEDPNQLTRHNYASSTSLPARSFSKRSLGINLRLILISSGFAIIALLVAYLLINFLPSSNKDECKSKLSTISFDQICTFLAPNGDSVGLSYGKFAFDTSRKDGVTKRQASAQLAAGDIQKAGVFWNSAIELEPNDAETLIYQENQRVLDSKHPYITFVIATTLSGNSTPIDLGRGALQGAYIIQKEFNAQNSSQRFQMRLLIANVGDQSTCISCTTASDLAKQIVAATQYDNKILGVIGWPINTDSTISALNILTQAHIPTISTGISSDQLTNNTSYFYSLIPSIKDQGSAGAIYAEKILHAKTAQILYDHSDLYSSKLAEEFKKQFLSIPGNRIIYERSYTEGQSETIFDNVEPGLRFHPDVVYFTGSADDLTTLLSDIREILGSSPTTSPQIIGGNNLYNINKYSGDPPEGFDHVSFTSFAYSGTWDLPGIKGRKRPSFFDDYARYFSRNSTSDQNSNNSFSNSGAPDGNTIVSYDALFTLSTAVKTATDSVDNKIRPSDLQQSLERIKGPNTIQGVSGQISFGANGAPIDKSIIILSFDLNGYIQVKPIMFGVFLR